MKPCWWIDCRKVATSAHLMANGNRVPMCDGCLSQLRRKDDPDGYLVLLEPMLAYSVPPPKESPGGMG